MTLPKECRLRLASAQDLGQIRWLVFRAKLDPTQLRWQQFRVIECEGSIVACGQLRNFPQAQELGSLVVLPGWRDRGMGTYLTETLIKEATKPLYLECLGKRRAKFYSRFGFVSVSWQDLPQSLKLKFGITQIGKTLLKIPAFFMQHCPNSE